MDIKNNKPENIEDYIASFPGDIQIILEKIRTIIRQAAPEATETISYAIPTFKMHKNLVHFAAFKNHIGFYPTPTGIEEFKKALSVYKQGKGSVQFPLNQPLPEKLISDIVKYQANLDQEKKVKKK